MSDSEFILTEEFYLYPSKDICKCSLNLDEGSLKIYKNDSPQEIFYLFGSKIEGFAEFIIRIHFKNPNHIIDIQALSQEQFEEWIEALEVCATQEPLMEVEDDETDDNPQVSNYNEDIDLNTNSLDPQVSNQIRSLNNIESEHFSVQNDAEELYENEVQDNSNFNELVQPLPQEEIHDDKEVEYNSNEIFDELQEVGNVSQEITFDHAYNHVKDEYFEDDYDYEEPKEFQEPIQNDFQEAETQEIQEESQNEEYIYNEEIDHKLKQEKSENSQEIYKAQNNETYTNSEDLHNALPENKLITDFSNDETLQKNISSALPISSNLSNQISSNILDSKPSRSSISLLFPNASEHVEDKGKEVEFEIDLKDKLEDEIIPINYENSKEVSLSVDRHFPDQQLEEISSTFSDGIYYFNNSSHTRSEILQIDFNKSKFLEESNWLYLNGSINLIEGVLSIKTSSNKVIEFIFSDYRIEFFTLNNLDSSIRLIGFTNLENEIISFFSVSPTSLVIKSLWYDYIISGIKIMTLFDLDQLNNSNEENIGPENWINYSNTECSSGDCSFFVSEKDIFLLKQLVDSFIGEEEVEEEVKKIEPEEIDTLSLNINSNSSSTSQVDISNSILSPLNTSISPQTLKNLPTKSLEDNFSPYSRFLEPSFGDSPFIITLNHIHHNSSKLSRRVNLWYLSNGFSIDNHSQVLQLLDHLHEQKSQIKDPILSSLVHSKEINKSNNIESTYDLLNIIRKLEDDSSQNTSNPTSSTSKVLKPLLLSPNSSNSAISNSLSSNIIQLEITVQLANNAKSFTTYISNEITLEELSSIISNNLNLNYNKVLQSLPTAIFSSTSTANFSPIGPNEHSNSFSSLTTSATSLAPGLLSQSIKSMGEELILAEQIILYQEKHLQNLTEYNKKQKTNIQEKDNLLENLFSQVEEQQALLTKLTSQKEEENNTEFLTAEISMLKQVNEINPNNTKDLSELIDSLLTGSFFDEKDIEDLNRNNISLQDVQTSDKLFVKLDDDPISQFVLSYFASDSSDLSMLNFSSNKTLNDLTQEVIVLAHQEFLLADKNQDNLLDLEEFSTWIFNKQQVISNYRHLINTLMQELNLLKKLLKSNDLITLAYNLILLMKKKLKDFTDELIMIHMEEQEKDERIQVLQNQLNDSISENNMMMLERDELLNTIKSLQQQLHDKNEEVTQLKKQTKESKKEKRKSIATNNSTYSDPPTSTPTPIPATAQINSTQSINPPVSNEIPFNLDVINKLNSDNTDTIPSRSNSIDITQLSKTSDLINSLPLGSSEPKNKERSESFSKSNPQSLSQLLSSPQAQNFPQTTPEIKSQHNDDNILDFKQLQQLSTTINDMNLGSSNDFSLDNSDEEFDEGNFNPKHLFQKLPSDPPRVPYKLIRPQLQNHPLRNALKMQLKHNSLFKNSSNIVNSPLTIQQLYSKHNFSQSISSSIQKKSRYFYQRKAPTPYTSQSQPKSASNTLINHTPVNNSSIILNHHQHIVRLQDQLKKQIEQQTAQNQQNYEKQQKLSSSLPNVSFPINPSGKISNTLAIVSNDDYYTLGSTGNDNIESLNHQMSNLANIISEPKNFKVLNSSFHQIPATSPISPNLSPKSSHKYRSLQNTLSFDNTFHHGSDSPTNSRSYENLNQEQLFQTTAPRFQLTTEAWMVKNLSPKQTIPANRVPGWK